MKTGPFVHQNSAGSISLHESLAGSLGIVGHISAAMTVSPDRSNEINAHDLDLDFLWISVDDQLPDSENVILISSSEGVDPARFIDGNFTLIETWTCCPCPSCPRVEYWMPMPKPAKKMR